MQHRYVGDIGDYMKLAILRALSPNYKLGVAWWLHANEGAPGDGRHIDYLKNPAEWRALDPHLFDGLGQVIAAGRRDVSALQDASFLRGATFSSEMLPTVPWVRRSAARSEWFARTQEAVHGCDLIFLDPDNGLEPARYSACGKKSGKSVMWAELAALRAPGRCIVVYHHHTRFKGGHLAEIDHLARRLRALGFQSVDALRARPYSPRAFFLLDANAEQRARAAQINRMWGDRISWHPDLGRAA